MVSINLICLDRESLRQIAEARLRPEARYRGFRVLTGRVDTYELDVFSIVVEFVHMVNYEHCLHRCSTPLISLSASAGMGSGRRHRADSGYEAAEVPRGECGRRVRFG